MRIACSMVLLVLGCGEVKKEEVDAPVAPPGDGPPAEDAPPDASLCTPLEEPPGSTALHTRFCVTALGFNSTVMPPSMNLACPGVGTNPGTYGLILRNPETRADGCPANPVTRILTPLVANAITQASTGNDVVVTAGSRFRMRLSCRQGIVNCRGNVQITARPAAGGQLSRVFPEQNGFQLVTTDDVIDVDVPVPAALVGNTTNFTMILQFAGSGTPDVLFENPHLAPM